MAQICSKGSNTLWENEKSLIIQNFTFPTMFINKDCSHLKKTGLFRNRLRQVKNVIL